MPEEKMVRRINPFINCCEDCWQLVCDSEPPTDGWFPGVCDFCRDSPKRPKTVPTKNAMDPAVERLHRDIESSIAFLGRLISEKEAFRRELTCTEKYMRGLYDGEVIAFVLAINQLKALGANLPTYRK